jgi:hypothetical protein
MTYRSFRRDKHLENGDHTVFLNLSNRHIMYHTTRFLKNRYKINITNTQPIRHTYETTYYPDKQQITVDKCNINDQCEQKQIHEFLLDYFQKYINSTIDHNYFTN